MKKKFIYLLALLMAGITTTTIMTLPSINTIATAAANKCKPVAPSDTLTMNDSRKQIIHKIPLTLDNTHGIRIFFVQGNSNKGIQASILEGSKKNWIGANHKLPIVSISENRKQIIYDWRQTAIYAQDSRVALIIRFPRNKNFNHTIIPYGTSSNAIRSVIPYASQASNGFVYSAFTPIANGVTKGVEIPKALNTLINQNTASGDILIPSTAKYRVDIQNLKVINSFQVCK